MRVGLAFTLRSPAGRAPDDDAEEEFDSPQTIAALTGVLQALGHAVIPLGDGEEMVRRLLDGPRPQLVVNLAEGRGAGRCREARVPAVLEMLGIPYTGSDPLTLAATLDKDCAKRLVRDAGVATPAWLLVEDAVVPDGELDRLAFPLFVKPACEGSSKGVGVGSIIRTPAALPAALRRLRRAYRQPLLVEEFIQGDELTVGLVGNRPPEVLGVMRVLPLVQTGRPFIYGIEEKRECLSAIRYECPPCIAGADIEATAQAALAAWRALGCRDVARMDFRLRDHVPYFLEANPLPGFTPGYSDLVFLAEAVGVPHRELIARILAAAVERYEWEPSP